MYNVTCPTGPDMRDPRTLDWTAHRSRALIGFDLDTDPAWFGVPVNPMEPNLPAGRGELWHAAGEAVAADALVFNTDRDGFRELLMIVREDGYGYAVPGGCLDAIGDDGDTETPLSAAVRELGEEASLFLSPTAFVPQRARYVPDPRAARHAWMVTVPHVAELHMATPPVVVARDDARRALWLPAGSWAQLESAVRARGGDVFAAHVPMLRDLLR